MNVFFPILSSPFYSIALSGTLHSGIILILLWFGLLFYAALLTTIATFLVKEKKVVLTDCIPLLFHLIYNKLRHANKSNQALDSKEKKIAFFIQPIIAILIKILLLKQYAIAHCFFFSALAITLYSDLTTMLISRFVTLFLIPFIWLATYANLLPLTLTQSIAGASFGYGFLFSIERFFYWYKKQAGLGKGDIELLAFIGSFIGILGCWFTIFFSSTVGLFIILLYLFYTKKNPKTTYIPFGPFLATGAIVFVLFESSVMRCMQRWLSF